MAAHNLWSNFLLSFCEQHFYFLSLLYFFPNKQGKLSPSLPFLCFCFCTRCIMFPLSLLLNWLRSTAIANMRDKLASQWLGVTFCNFSTFSYIFSSSYFIYLITMFPNFNWCCHHGSKSPPPPLIMLSFWQMTIGYFAVILEMRWTMMFFQRHFRGFLRLTWLGYVLIFNFLTSSWDINLFAWCTWTVCMSSSDVYLKCMELSNFWFMLR